MFLNNKFRVLKLQFSKILPPDAKDDTFKKFYKFVKNQLNVCCTFYKENFTSFYALWEPKQIVWGSLKNKKR